MKILQLGAGAMGTRRLRDLRPRPDLSLGVYDERPDRRAAAQERFGIPGFARLEEAIEWSPQALIVSTPPGSKGMYINLALRLGLHHFSESDIWTYGVATRTAHQQKLVSAPSASLAFLPLFRELRRLVADHLGTLLSYQACRATSLPVNSAREAPGHYGHRRHTALARELVPFELNYLSALFGPVGAVAGRFEKFGLLPGATEDTWSLSMRLEAGGVGQLTVSMASPVDVWRGACFGTEAALTWDILQGTATLAAAGAKERQHFDFGAFAEVADAVYAEEINTFVDAALTGGKWPYPYRRCQQVSATLAAAEQSSVTGRWVAVEPEAEPDPAPPRAD